MIFTKVLKKIFIFLIILISPITLYLSVAFGLTFFPTQELTIEEKNHKIYLIYNPFHCDIVLNIEEISNSKIKELSLISKKEKGFISFGWGDRKTYLNTPTWEDIKLSTSLKALFLNTPSLMHVNYYNHIENFENIKVLSVSKKQKKQLENSLLKGFSLNKKSYQGYGRNDLFYDSPFMYNFIFTCNTWVGQQLQNANISVSPWTPFSYNIIQSLPE